MGLLVQNPVMTVIGSLLIMEVATQESMAYSQNYGEALSKSILFFEGQRSGRLPSDQRMTWRKDSALQDGSHLPHTLSPNHFLNTTVDLVGGYYDAGDNVKFNFPMAFTTTMLSWSVKEFGEFMGKLDLNYALDAIRWGTDYLMKATSVPGLVFAVVGDPNSDHNCWERPEDMDTSRRAFAVSNKLPGSEVSAEIAAALAASSVVFKNYYLIGYSSRLLNRAIKVFEFADTYRGSYNDSLGPWVCPFYCDFSGYQHGCPSGWDTKDAGINVLISKFLINSSSSSNKPFIVSNANKLICSVLPESPTASVSYSPGGLLFKAGGSDMQHATSLSFLFLVYASYFNFSNPNINCGGHVLVTPQRLVQFARGQVDYILRKNPLNMSYMVGYGPKYPQRIHHRALSLPSLENQPEHTTCKGGSSYFETQNPNPNLLLGAVVGGPDFADSYSDSRPDFPHSEPATYINAPLVGALAYFKSHSSSYLY